MLPLFLHFTKIRGFFGDENKKPRIYAVFLMCGGGGGNRTLVRKPLNITFSGCRAPFLFPAPSPDARGERFGSFFLYDRFKSKPAMHIYHEMTPEPKPWCSSGGRAALRSGGAAYAASATLLLAFNFKLELFKRIPDLYPLIISQNPRRNLYAPIGSGLKKAAL